jgi:hypothetical protein
VVRPTATRNQYCYIETTVPVISLIRNTQNDVYLTMAHLLAYHRGNQENSNAAVDLEIKEESGTDEKRERRKEGTH